MDPISVEISGGFYCMLSLLVDSLDLLAVDLTEFLSVELVEELGFVRGWLPVGISLSEETPVVGQWTVGSLWWEEETHTCSSH